MYIYMQLYISIFLIATQLLSHLSLFMILWTVAQQVSLSIGFPRQEY